MLKVPRPQKHRAFKIKMQPGVTLVAKPRELRMQLDIQVSTKQVLVVKIYEGDSAQEIFDQIRT